MFLISHPPERAATCPRRDGWLMQASAAPQACAPKLPTLNEGAVYIFHIAASLGAGNCTAIRWTVLRNPHTAIISRVCMQVEFTDIHKEPGVPARTKLPNDEPKAAPPKEKKLQLPLLSRMS